MDNDEFCPEIKRKFKIMHLIFRLSLGYESDK